MKQIEKNVTLTTAKHPNNCCVLNDELSSDALETIEVDFPTKPLSLDAIHNIFGICALNSKVILTWEQCEQIARQIEKAHGIV